MRRCTDCEHSFFAAVAAVVVVYEYGGDVGGSMAAVAYGGVGGW